MCVNDDSVVPGLVQIRVRVVRRHVVIDRQDVWTHGEVQSSAEDDPRDVATVVRDVRVGAIFEEPGLVGARHDAVPVRRRDLLRLLHIHTKY